MIGSFYEREVEKIRAEQAQFKVEVTPTFGECNPFRENRNGASARRPCKARR
jgi:hypothetical protein